MASVLQPLNRSSMISAGAHNETFMTEAGVVTIPEPEAMARVREEHGHLQAVLGTLNRKISGVLSKQEADFLVAYRAHMYSIQKELQTLRQRVVDAENALQRNDKVQKLEDACEWYRREALRLDGFNTAMQKDLKYMKDKLGILVDDRKWLVEQLKICKKQNKLLRAELESHLQHDEGGGIRPPSPGKNGGLRVSKSQPGLRTMDNLEALTRPTTSLALMHSKSKQALPVVSGDSNQIFGSNEQRRRPGGPVLSSCRPSTRASTAASTFAHSHVVQRAELEEFFVQCVEDTRKEVARRRRAQNASARAATANGASSTQNQNIFNSLDNTGLNGTSNMNNSMNASMNNSRRKNHLAITADSPLSLEQAAALSVAHNPQVSLDDLSASDRRAVLEKLLINDEAVAALFDKVFPREKSNNMGAARQIQQTRKRAQTSTSTRAPPPPQQLETHWGGKLWGTGSFIPDDGIDQPITTESGSQVLKLDSDTLDYLQSIKSVRGDDGV